MTIVLNQPLEWKKASHEEQQMLEALQGNILKGHGRPETVNIFFRLDPAQAQASRRTLRQIGVYHLTNAYEQLLETERFQQSGESGKTFVAAFLSFTGYQAIGKTALAPTGEAVFHDGMKAAASLSAVSDKLPDWEAHFKEQIDGMVLVGDMVRNRVRLKRDEIAALLKECGATIVHEQIGSAIKDKQDNGIEHFGYVDGRSQPLMLKEDIDKESRDAGIARWDPQFNLDSALVKDMPGVAGDTTSFGSYFIFRKLEQKVRDFKLNEQLLADKLKLKGAELRERAGAQVVGRFEDGTPVTLSDEAKGLNPPNDFDYTGDAGLRCPFQAHIRKVNPRGSGPGGAADERKHIMPRRGIPFEDTLRVVHASDLPPAETLKKFKDDVMPLLPKGDVGLLFMAYNASLAKQFVFTQASWANSAGFPTAGAGVDPVIGQGASAGPGPAWREDWDEPASGVDNFDFHGFVTMRGGEYFFAPSLTFFKTL